MEKWAQIRGMREWGRELFNCEKLQSPNWSFSFPFVSVRPWWMENYWGNGQFWEVLYRLLHFSMHHPPIWCSYYCSSATPFSISSTSMARVRYLVYFLPKINQTLPADADRSLSLSVSTENAGSAQRNRGSSIWSIILLLSETGSNSPSSGDGCDIAWACGSSRRRTSP